MERLSLTEKEIFLKSHSELVDFVKWLNKPMIWVARGSRVDIEKLCTGEVIISDVPEDVEIKYAIPKESMEKIINTFCESHLRLKND